MRIAPNQVEVLNKKVNKVKLRVLLYTSAHISAIRRTTCKTLGLEIENSNEKIIGVNETSTQPVEGNVKTSKQPKHGKMFNRNCVGLYHTTNSVNPKSKIATEEIEHA